MGKEHAHIEQDEAEKYEDFKFFTIMGLGLEKEPIREGCVKITKSKEISYNGINLTLVAEKEGLVNRQGKKTSTNYKFYIKDKDQVVIRSFMRIIHYDDFSKVTCGVYRESEKTGTNSLGRLLHDKMTDYIQYLADIDQVVYKDEAVYDSDIPFDKWHNMFGFEEKGYTTKYYNDDEPYSSSYYYLPNQ